MEILAIRREMYSYPDMFLRMKSRRVNKNEVLGESFRDFISEMFRTLYGTKNGVGLAAPQVGRMIRVAVIDRERTGEHPIVLINPSYEPTTDETVDSTEGCLSFPGITCIVKRHTAVRVRTKDMNYQDVVLELTGFPAIVAQHEIDHLDGCVFIDKAHTIVYGDDIASSLASIAMNSLDSM